MEEIELLHNENKREEKLLEENSGENTMTQEKLHILEKHKEDFLFEIEQMKTQNDGIANLRNELNHARTFAYERCENKLESKSDFKVHRGDVHGRNNVWIMWKQNLIESEKEISNNCKTL